MAEHIQDLFYGPPASLLAAHTPNYGGPWVIPAGRTPTIAGDALTPWLNSGSIYLPANSGGPYVPQALAPGNIAGDVSLVFTLYDPAGAQEQLVDMGALARYQDATDWYGLFYRPSNLDLALWRMTPGGEIALWGTFIGQPDPPVVVQWEISGATHWMRTSTGVDETFEDTDTPITDPGQVGIMGTANGVATRTTGTHLSQFLAVAGLIDAFPTP